MARPQRAWTVYTARAAMLGATAAMLLGLAWLVRSDLDRSDKLAVVGLAVALAAVVMAIPQSRAAIIQLRQPSGMPSVDQAVLDRAAEQLATAVRAQWHAEVGLRGLHRPEPLRLAWTASTRPVAAPAHTVTGATIAGRVVRLRLHGHLDEIADRFLALPRRRLVVLGTPALARPCWPCCSPWLCSTAASLTSRFRCSSACPGGTRPPSTSMPGWPDGLAKTTPPCGALASAPTRPSGW